MTSRVPVHVLVVVLLGALVGVGVAVAAAALGGPERLHAASPPTAGSAMRASSRSRTAAREVLREWDAARASAWTSGDTAALARLYTPRSVAGERDVAMLRAWNRRARRVTAITTQVLAVRVVVEARRRLVLVVTDRLARVAAGGDTLPHDRASTRRIVLRHTTMSGWQVASSRTALRPGRS